MKQSLYRGTMFIGTITLPSESGAPVFGMEVLAETPFHDVDLDGDNHFESFERAENHLHRLYEARCASLGITPEPRAPKPEEIDEDAAYYAREAAREQAEIAAHDAAVEASLLERTSVPAHVDPVPSPEVVAAADDDFPF